MRNRFLFSASLAALLVCGCQSQSGDAKLKVGVLDTARILSEMPKYRDMQGNLQREQAEFQQTLPQRGDQVSQERYKQIQASVEKRRSEWQKRVNQTLKDAIKDIRDLTAQVADEKKLDMVVVSTPFSRSVHYSSGQDVTIDVLLKMKR